jgi:hypothetical protein
MRVALYLATPRIISAMPRSQTNFASVAPMRKSRGGRSSRSIQTTRFPVPRCYAPAFRR